VFFSLNTYVLLIAVDVIKFLAHSVACHVFKIAFLSAVLEKVVDLF